MQFEWDPAKATKNLHKHKVSFAEAATVFADDFSVTIYDPDHSEEEERYIIIGVSQNNRLLMISHTEYDDRIRLISARKLTLAEREAYEEGIES